METASTSAKPVPVIEEEERTTTRRNPRYNVVLLDDNDHTYDYVLRMLMKLFGYSKQRAYVMACEVDRTGRVIVLTTTREHAELKQEQIHGFGPDQFILHCKGSMSAVVEPALEA